MSVLCSKSIAYNGEIIWLSMHVIMPLWSHLGPLIHGRWLRPMQLWKYSMTNMTLKIWFSVRIHQWLGILRHSETRQYKVIIQCTHPLAIRVTQLKVFSELSLAFYTIIPSVMFSVALQIEFQDWPIGRRNRQEIPKFGKSFSDLFLVDRARSVRWANLWKHFSLRNFFPLDVSSEGPSTKVG